MRFSTLMAEKTRPAEECVICGEGVEPRPSGCSSILCESCLETADLPMSAYYMAQFYYRFAD